MWKNQQDDSAETKALFGKLTMVKCFGNPKPKVSHEDTFDRLLLSYEEKRRRKDVRNDDGNSSEEESEKNTDTESFCLNVNKEKEFSPKMRCNRYSKITLRKKSVQSNDNDDDKEKENNEIEGLNKPQDNDLEICGALEKESSLKRRSNRYSKISLRKKSVQSNNHDDDQENENNEIEGLNKPQDTDLEMCGALEEESSLKRRSNRYSKISLRKNSVQSNNHDDDQEKENNEIEGLNKPQDTDLEMCGALEEESSLKRRRNRHSKISVRKKSVQSNDNDDDKEKENNEIEGLNKPQDNDLEIRGALEKESPLKRRSNRYTKITLRKKSVHSNDNDDDQEKENNEIEGVNKPQDNDLEICDMETNSGLKKASKNKKTFSKKLTLKKTSIKSTLDKENDINNSDTKCSNKSKVQQLDLTESTLNFPQANVSELEQSNQSQFENFTTEDIIFVKSFPLCEIGDISNIKSRKNSKKTSESRNKASEIPKNPTSAFQQSVIVIHDESDLSNLRESQPINNSCRYNSKSKLPEDDISCIIINGDTIDNNDETNKEEESKVIRINSELKNPRLLYIRDEKTLSSPLVRRELSRATCSTPIAGKQKNIAMNFSIIEPSLRLTVEPGKRWRRSLSVLKRNRFDATHRKSLGKGGLSTLSDISKSEISVRVVLNGSPDLGNLTSLESYANSIVNQTNHRAAVAAPATANETEAPSILLRGVREEDEDEEKPEEVKGRRIEDGGGDDARDVVLARCGQTDVLDFDECYPDWLLRNCQKIGEGVYGEVFLVRNPTDPTHRRPTDGPIVLKVVPIEGRLRVNGERQKRYAEVLSEVACQAELSKLTGGFARALRFAVVRGRYPARLLELWELYDETRGSENDSPAVFDADQLYVVVEMESGGVDLERFGFRNARETWSAFRQLAAALARAERELEFEHRDLHWGNVLVERAGGGGHGSSSSDEAVKVTIIDFTMSRMRCDHVVLYNDLALDEDLFDMDGDLQFDVYRMMRDANGNNWEKFVPYTNVLWLHYILDKMIHAVTYKNRKSKVHSKFMNELKRLDEDILQYKSAEEFFANAFCS